MTFVDHTDPFSDHHKFELHYSWGGHGGPHTDGYYAALQSAVALIRGKKNGTPYDYVEIRIGVAGLLVAKVTRSIVEDYDRRINRAAIIAQEALSELRVNAAQIPKARTTLQMTEEERRERQAEYDDQNPPLPDLPLP